MSGRILFLCLAVWNFLFISPDERAIRIPLEKTQEAVSIPQKNKNGLAKPICQVKREVYVQSPGPGVAAIVGVNYMGPGLRRREIHAQEAKSDLGEKYRIRYSDDNGRTWSRFEPVSLGTDTLKRGENYGGNILRRRL